MKFLDLLTPEQLKEYKELSDLQCEEYLLEKLDKVVRTLTFWKGLETTGPCDDMLKDHCQQLLDKLVREE